MLLLGDIAVQDRNNHLGLHRADYLLRDLQLAWQELVATIPVYATWDDHDYFDNDKAGVPSGFTKIDKVDVCDVFRLNWNNPSYGFNDDRHGVFLRTRIGPCDVIMVDNRYFRENRKGSFLGDKQMEWLEQQLLDCQGPFIILSCGSMWSDFVSSGKDSWGMWDPAGRERIFSLIEENQIGGVLLISGDRHGARGFRIPRPSGFEFYEFEAASLGGRRGPPATKSNWKTQLYGIANKYAFGEFSFDASIPDPEVTFRLIGDDGTVIYELTLKRSQLTPGSKQDSDA
jgi:alkaline phosphatase D